MPKLLKVPVLLRVDEDIGDGMIFERETFSEAMKKAMEKGLFIHYGQEASEELDLMSAIGKVKGFHISYDNSVFLDVEFLEVYHSQATIQRLELGWTTTSMKALGITGDDKIVRELVILGFVESKKK